ncbi:LIM domain containing protein [Trichomonas vaginalis G3]|uniref:LIM domain containing protein n=1 Tax=Trichomonas vaginalis (strain ATCC PRA-98 / G3) TaxID=412133 RepID=A2E8S0_TRIV3|nr:uncharacterized protein TVAGG3_0927030 [Trichomonas vaginalis G3]EAY10902.1 LIM domain containing protein [Trichomonas vaginalis G3]KAI5485559.1 zinc ion binding [Trichomonas vaginalis G3]|eukprot:XP_001323125.1 hypothetical protein [Trichomonas vaginalis G3]
MNQYASPLVSDDISSNTNVVNAVGDNSDEYYSDSESKSDKKALIKRKRSDKKKKSSLIEIKPKDYQGSSTTTLLIPGEDYGDRTIDESSHSSWIADANNNANEDNGIVKMDSDMLLSPPQTPTNLLDGEFTNAPIYDNTSILPTSFDDTEVYKPLPKQEEFKQPKMRENKSFNILPNQNFVMSRPGYMLPKSKNPDEPKLQIYDGMDSGAIDSASFDSIPTADIKFGSDIFASQTDNLRPTHNYYDPMTKSIEDQLQSTGLTFMEGASMLKPAPSNSKLPTIPDFAKFNSKFAAPAEFSTMALSHLCEVCKKSITGEYKFVNGIYYHVQCLKCASCLKVLSDDNAYQFQGYMMCKECILAAMNRRCKACNLLILNPADGVTLHTGEVFHSNCIGCYRCCMPIKGQSYIEIDGKVYCKACDEFMKKHKCNYCHNSIVSYDYVVHNQKYFHKDHFRCCMCDKVLKGDDFIVHHNKFYCPEHGAPYEDSCMFCRKRFNLLADKVKFNGKFYHTHCFICRVCGCRLQPPLAKSFHERPHCKECYDYRKSIEMNNIHKHIPEKSQQLKQKVSENRDVAYVQYTGSSKTPLEGPPIEDVHTISTPNIDELTFYS